MKARTPTDRGKHRIRLMLGLMLALQGGILVFLWNLQVVKGHTFQENISRQSLRRVRHPGPRGKIVDRKGIVLADNRPSIGIALYLEELRVPGPASRTIDRVEALLDEMSREIELPRRLTRREVESHYRQQRLLPLMAWTDLDDHALARWAERLGPRPGMDLLVDTVRTYPYGDLLAQTLGYVGRGGTADREEEGSYDFYLPEMEGKAGLELVLDRKLRGQAGGELVRVDVSMYRYNVEAKRPPVAGLDAQLTIDARVQRLCERILGDQTGSMVVMDPRNGEILALATQPRYDLNDMTPFISNKVWGRLTGDPRRPLVNRPVREHYPPGSVIKPFICLAALTHGKLEADRIYTCDGNYYPGPAARPMHCHNRFGHGPLNMREAIERSCNDYMWQLAEDTGYQPVYETLDRLGLGEETGVEVDYEVPGILPTDAWKRRHYGDSLRTGDIANLVIGQGFLNVTALQMASLTATLANGGALVPPTLLRGFRAPEEEDFTPSEARKPGADMGWSSADVEVVHEGMRDVVMSPRGTARTARVDGLVYAGKTGTAQFGSPGNRRYRSWMIAFAPYDNPRIAAVVLIDSGLGSGVDAAPRMKLLMRALFGGRRDG